MKTNTEIRQLFKVAMAVLLSVSVMSQSGFVSFTTHSCSSCFDKAGKAETPMCCKFEATLESNSNACFSKEPCCETQKLEKVFFSISNKVENLIPLTLFSDAFIAEDSFDLLAGYRLPFRYTHSKAPPLGGRAILQFICKYSL